jgi:hypothetical protein
VRKGARYPIFIVGLLIVFAACSGTGRRAVTTGSLFEEMIDLAALAEFPEPGYRMVQYSSYDRRSRVPGGPDWFANGDGFGGEKIPNFESVLKEPDASGVGEYVMADVSGPGAVVRLWTASISGKIRFYIDDMERPLYEGDADPFFRRPYDVLPEIKPIEGDVFRRTAYQRDASYAPFPFAKRLRIVWIGKVADIHFYHIQVRLYELGTKIKSFRPGDIEKYREVIDRATMALSDPDARISAQTRRPAVKIEASIPPGEKKELVALKGPGAIARLVLRLRADDLDRALRQTVLNVVCDGSARPQIHSPVGDFFGAAPGVNPYESLPFSVKDDGTMICRFIMPFQTSLSIVLENRGEQNADVAGEIVPADFVWDENSLHFYARWRVDHNLIASGEEVQDLPFVLARGRGVYVGTASILLNPAVVPSSWGNWWGEGDEKVFVDDDTRPSLFGTGSEDYYNYSWSSPDIFSYPYCGQPRNDGPGNRGFVSNVRWHILDAIPFGRSLSFYMELFSHERTPGVSYARIGYFYGRPGTFDDHQAIMPEDLRPLALPETWEPAARFGARNSVFFQAEDLLTDPGATRMDTGGLWARGRTVVWTPEKAGAVKTLAFAVDSPGRKKIHLTAALTPRAGKISLWLDGRPAILDGGGSAIDLYWASGILLRDFALEPVDLAAGEHTLALEFQGAEKASGPPEIGIDFIWVQKVD